MKLSEETIKKEKKRLENTIEEIEHQLSHSEHSLTESNEELKNFQRLRWEQEHEMDQGERYSFVQENDTRIQDLDEKTKKVRNLLRIKDKPYFGSFIFNDEEIYLGITSVKKEMDYIVYDWRAPICSLFYDFELGHAKYTSPGGSEEGEITQKRQYRIEKGKLKHVFDTNINIDDDLLQEVLAESSNEKMKNIVNTIQMEQNRVIRDESTKAMIVQGIAGSGKTSVALHRIAFLLYKIEYLTSQNVLIFSPNNVFTEYISNVLPDLGEENTLQTTYHQFASSFISEYERVESYSSFVERFYKGVRQDNDLIGFKLSDSSIKCIESYAKLYTKAARFIGDLEYKKQVIPMDELNELLHMRFDKQPLFERVELIAEKINNRYFKGIKGDYNKILSALYKIANFKKDYIAIYKNLFETLLFKEQYPHPIRKNENLRNLSGNVIHYEDASPFIYLKCLLEGFPYQVHVRHVVIDEAQDYTYLQYKIMKRIFKNATFTILGDIHQTVNPYYHYESLQVLEGIFKENHQYVELKKSYRSSPEIIEYANKILGLSHVSAIRKNIGIPVVHKDIRDLRHIGKDIKYLKDKYKSVAVITKSIDEAKILAGELKKKYSKTSVIDIDTEKYNRELIVAPAYGVKGLEFDCAIIVNNFSDDHYLYYVAVTRCQHELIIYE